MCLPNEGSQLQSHNEMPLWMQDTKTNKEIGPTFRVLFRSELQNNGQELWKTASAPIDWGIRVWSDEFYSTINI